MTAAAVLRDESVYCSLLPGGSAAGLARSARYCRHQCSHLKSFTRACSCISAGCLLLRSSERGRQATGYLSKNRALLAALLVLVLGPRHRLLSSACDDFRISLASLLIACVLTSFPLCRSTGNSTPPNPLPLSSVTSRRIATLSADAAKFVVASCRELCEGVCVEGHCWLLLVV